MVSLTLLILSTLLQAAPAFERSYLVKRVAPIRITNRLGDIHVQGWSLDKIKIEASPAEGVLLPSFDILYDDQKSEIEITANYGKNLSLSERMKDRAQSKNAVNLHVFAPLRSDLEVWMNQGEARVTHWKGALGIRSEQGKIELGDIDAKTLTIRCPDCAMGISDVHAKVRIFGGTQSITVQGFDTSHAYIEASSGGIKINRSQGELLLVTHLGKIEVGDHVGKIEFQSRQGNVLLSNVSGALFGKTSSGNVDVDFMIGKKMQKSILESDSGNIKISFPHNLTFELDAKTETGSITSNLNWEEKKTEKGRTSGRIGQGGEPVVIRTKSGSIDLK